MRNKGNLSIYSGASPEDVAQDLKPLVDFQEEGMPLNRLRTLLEERLIPHLMKYNNTGFQSMFNAFPEKGAEFGAKIALAYNQGVTGWQVSPGGATLEELCCKELCSLFNLSPSSGATIMYSGTYANQQALYLALHHCAEKHGFDFSMKGLMGFSNPGRLTVLTSVDAHFSIKLAMRMLGLGEENIVVVPVDANRRLNVSELKKTVNAIGDTQEIFCIVATAGTTATGSVDPIKPIAEIAGQAGSWLHVDGAYGLAYSLVPEWKPLFEGIDRADSVCWDPHKQFSVPIPSSVLFVKRRDDFFRITMYGDYFNRKEDPEPNPGLKSPPTTRPFAALPLVTSLKYQGMKKLIRRLKAPLNAIKKLADYLSNEKDIELCHKPDTGILCFRILPEGLPVHRQDELQKYIYDRIMKTGKRTIAITRLDGKTVLRIVVISPAITGKILTETIHFIRSLTKEFLAQNIKKG